MQAMQQQRGAHLLPVLHSSRQVQRGSHLLLRRTVSAKPQCRHSSTAEPQQQVSRQLQAQQQGIRLAAARAQSCVWCVRSGAAMCC